MSQIVNKQEPPALALHSSIPQGLVVSPDSRLRHAQAETMARYQMAFMLQREWISVGPKLLALCDDPEFAVEAYYRRPGEGGGRDSEGLTIRFAEAALRIMRNVSVDTTPEMEDDHAVHVRLTVLDLESNTPTSETFRVDKTMVKFSVQDDDIIIAERTHAASGKKMWIVQASEEQISARVRGKAARVKRALILSLIPAEVRAQCLAKVRSVVTTADTKDPGAAIKGIVSAFIGMGIDVPDLKEYLGKSPAQATPLQIEELRSILVMLREGDVSWNQVLADKRAAMETKGAKAAFVAAKEKEKEKQKASKPPTQRRPRAAAAASSDGAAAPAAAAEKVEDPKPAPAPAKPRASRRGDDEEAEEGSGEQTSNSTPA